MKNKIPIWDNYDRYLPELRWGILGGLLAVSDQDYQVRKWLKDEGPEVDWRHESSLSFEDNIRWFKQILRSGELMLNCETVKAILRVYVMWNRFDWMMMRDPNVPEGYIEMELYMINHPYWGKVCKQAEYALSLIEV